MTVIVHEGTYVLAAPLMFDDRDAAPDGCVTFYRTAPGAKVVLSGGRRVSGLKAGADGRWQASAGVPHFEQLYVNGRRATRSRLPNEGRFHMENLRGALDQPGEWFLGRDGLLQYIPRPGETMETVEMIAPTQEKLLIINGAANIVFEGLAFKHAGYNMPEGGFEATQAAAPIEAVVQVDRARGITLRNCEIAHAGIYGVWFRLGCRDCRVDHCYLHDLGGRRDPDR